VPAPTKPPPRFHQRIEQHPSDPKRRRFSTSLWQGPARASINVGDAERIVSAGIGAGLTAYGMAQGNLRGFLLAGLGAGLVYRGMSGQCLLYRELGVDTSNSSGAVTSVPSGRGVRVEKTIFVRRPIRDLYDFWRDLSNLPRVMSHLDSVTEDGDRSHWKVKTPLGIRLEWDAVIHNERPPHLIAWRSVDDSEVDSAGSVHFTESDDGQGTEIHVELKYDPPAGVIGAQIARWLGQDPAAQIDEDLRNFKQAMEANGPMARQPVSTTQR
jgi:uncharacterized membrane protein